MRNAKLWLVLGMSGLMLLSACASSASKRHLGQMLEAPDLKALEGATGEHVYTTKAFVTRYRYTVDPGGGRLMLNGSITAVLDPTRHRLGAILTRMQYEAILVSVLLADESGQVVDVQQMRLYPYGQIFYAVPFQQVLAYRPEYHGITLRITAYMYDGAARMYSRQINAFETQESGGVDSATFGW